MPSSTKSAFKARRILITSGPTSVPIDDMRVITNRSTGEMGRLLAAVFVKVGANVTLLEGAVTTALPLPSAVQLKKFYFYDELAIALKNEVLKAYDIVVHAAAVSDFSLKKIFKGKIDSHDQKLLALKPTVKLIGLIKKFAPATCLVGFKFETDIVKKSTLQKAKRLITQDECSFVVVNENGSRGYRATLLAADGKMSRIVSSKKALANLLVKSL
ncbi:MAG: hypothetical protein HQL22_00045 [Candidatus Omnitrophica bacterium]|nr:hypothetical protein [Candidatus Omnitrophota bacterium]